MERLFPGYFGLSEPDRERLWKDARIVLDANVLLNVYRYSDPTRTDLLTVLRGFQERLWMPFQYAHEFADNRFKVILEMAAAYEQIKKDIEKTAETLRHKRHPFSTEGRLKQLDGLVEELDQERLLREKLLSDDPHLKELRELLEGRIGDKPDKTTLEDLQKEGKQRYAGKIPPGYADRDKGEPDCFGDYVGWTQILDYAANKKVSILLVTDDDKEDWWYRLRGRTFGPRHELVAEFKSRVDQDAVFHMYTVDSFLRYAKEKGSTVSQETLTEVSERSRSEAPENLKARDMWNWLETDAMKALFKAANLANIAKVSRSNSGPTTFLDPVVPIIGSGEARVDSGGKHTTRLDDLISKSLDGVGDDEGES